MTPAPPGWSPKVEPLLQKPPALHLRSRVALVAPAGAPVWSRVEAGTAILESWGLEIVGLAEATSHRYLAGPDHERCLALEQALADPSISAVLSVRGGYGAARLAPTLCLDGIASHPKIFVGYSDITLLLDRIASDQQVVAFHGPMVGSDLPDLNDESLERYRRFLFGEEGWWEGACQGSWRSGSGSGEGRLAGGCLSVLVTTLGTPWEIETEGAVLFLEDIDERPYSLDRMFTHLRQAGKLHGLAGLVLGSFLECGERQGSPTDPDLLREIVMEAVEGTDYPVLYGFDAGHGSGNVVLPIGCVVGVDGTRAHVELLESALAE
ncbi:MAG: muramoyltetrapeptide carboxypeptidase [Hyphomicrobiaceae bacterium]|jgi:muramoyltetrapeptide carboxypeptidase